MLISRFGDQKLSKRSLALIIILYWVLTCQGTDGNKSPFEVNNLLDVENEPKTDSMEDTNMEVIKGIFKDKPNPNSILAMRARRFAVTGPKWNKTNLTWKLLNNNFLHLNVSQVRDLFVEAFEKWARVSRLTFKESNNTDADIQISFKRLSGGSYIHIDKPKPDGSPCRPSFNENTDWVLYGEDENSGVLLLPLALYVFGHALGLSDSSVNKSVMYSRYVKPLPQKLNEDDIIGIQFLYGKPEMDETSKSPSRISLKGTTHLTMAASSTSMTVEEPSTMLTTTTTTTKPPATTTKLTTAKKLPFVITNPMHHDTTKILSTTTPYTNTLLPKKIGSPSDASSQKTPLTFLKRKTNNGKAIFSPNEFEFGWKDLIGVFESVIVRRKPIFEPKTALNSRISPTIICIFSTCQF